MVTVSLGAVVNANALVGPPRSSPRDPFGTVDAAMRRRLRDQGGGAVLVVHDRTTLHRRTFGRMRAGTVLPIASASKWLTSATLMTLVDQGRVSLDDPVARFVPTFQGDKASITIRSLLSHTSGLPDADCVDDETTTLDACVDRIGSGAAPVHPVGRVFHYSGVGYEIVGRIIEAITGQTFEQAFETQLGYPTGMRQTRFDQIGRVKIRNPDPSASGVSTPDDYARFLDMILHQGMAGPQRILSPSSVAEIERDQVAGLDTSQDPAVVVTRIRTYGLGVWRDVTDALDGAVIVSGNGGLGFYPWIDRSHNNFGMVAVDDERGNDRAVPASEHVAKLEWTAAATRS